MSLDTAPILADVMTALSTDGVPVTVYHRQGIPDLVKGQMLPAGTPSSTGFAIRVSNSSGGRSLRGDYLTEPNGVNTELATLVCTPFATPPRKKDLVMFNGNYWTVQTSEVIAPTGVALINKIEVVR